MSLTTILEDARNKLTKSEKSLSCPSFTPRDSFNLVSIHQRVFFFTDLLALVKHLQLVPLQIELMLVSFVCSEVN